MQSDGYRRFEKIAAEKIPESPVAVVWNRAPFLPFYYGVKPIEFYLNSSIKLDLQTRIQNQFPRAVVLPGISADFGLITEASAFGGGIKWLEHSAPHIFPAIKNTEQIDHLKLPDCRRDGLMPKALEEYEYMWRHIDKKMIQDYGYLEGSAYTVGPCETAGLVFGYDNLYTNLIDNPSRIHGLLNIITEMVVNWIRAQEKINGSLKRLILVDHTPSQISGNMVEEFFMPYLKKVFDEFPKALKLYHNEGNVDHVTGHLSSLGFDVFHFGIDIDKAVRGFGNRCCFMGNIHPVEALLQGSRNDVRNACIKALNAARGYPFLLSSAGGMAPNTPPENLQEMVNAVE